LQLPAPPTGGAATPLANFSLGHLESRANLAAPIICNLPVVKSVNPTQVQAGNQFVYTIQIPDPAKLNLIDCDLSNVTATDNITDIKGDPTFTVVSASNGGTVSQPDSRHATINWTGLSYTHAPEGQPNTPPITLYVTVAVPATSDPGQIQDIINATASPTNCHGGASGIAGLGSGGSISGSFTLPQPAVLAATIVPTVQASANLPHTGGTGGLWQPFLGLLTLAAGGAALAMVRRSRRRTAG
ncbi:MAG: LPXTG cell wall anchor domain-containing protein, partial [Actinomycetes bacterium]